MPRRHVEETAGPSQRQLRVGELIRRTVSEILLRDDLHEPDLAGVSITVGEVRTSPDLRVATVFVLPLGGRDVDRTLAALNRARNEIRRSLTRTIRLRHSPELRFVVDESYDRMDHTRQMLGQDSVRRDLDADDGDEDMDDAEEDARDDLDDDETPGPGAR